MANQKGYLNEITGQNLTIKKKEFGEHYLVWLSASSRSSEDEGREISPVYRAKSRAESFAVDWMDKHPKGID